MVVELLHEVTRRPTVGTGGLSGTREVGDRPSYRESGDKGLVLHWMQRVFLCYLCLTVSVRTSGTQSYASRKVRGPALPTVGTRTEGDFMKDLDNYVVPCFPVKCT